MTAPEGATVRLMQRRLWIVLLTALVGCNDGGGGMADTEAMCEGYGEDPNPCCCYPEPGVVACDEVQLCPTIEADCEDGTLGDGTCVLDQASDGAVMCALNVLADAGSEGSIAWTIRESGGSKVSEGTLHLGGSRAAMDVSTQEAGDTTLQAYAGSLPDDFDAQACTAFNEAGQRFECMLNATALADSLTCHDVTTPDA